LEPYKGKGSVSVMKVILWKPPKRPHVKFQAEHVGNMYMLQNSEVTLGGLQLSSASEATVVK